MSCVDWPHPRFLDPLPIPASSTEIFLSLEPFQVLASARNVTLLFPWVTKCPPLGHPQTLARIFLGNLVAKSRSEDAVLSNLTTRHYNYLWMVGAHA